LSDTAAAKSRGRKYELVSRGIWIWGIGLAGILANSIINGIELELIGLAAYVGAGAGWASAFTIANAMTKRKQDGPAQ
jgi:hypothetical protein